MAVTDAGVRNFKLRDEKVILKKEKTVITRDSDTPAVIADQVRDTTTITEHRSVLEHVEHTFTAALGPASGAGCGSDPGRDTEGARKNPNVPTAESDYDIAGAQGLVSSPGSGQTIVVVDGSNGMGMLGDHYRFEGGVVAITAPNATIKGATLKNGYIDAGLGKTPDVTRVNNAIDCAVAQAGAKGIISYVASFGGLTPSEQVAALDKLGNFVQGGGAVVMGNNGLTLSDPSVVKAIKENGIILVNADVRGSSPAGTLDPSKITASGQSIPSGAGSAVALSAPTELGHGSAAVPFVAGTVALMRQANPSISGYDIQAILSDPSHFSQSTATLDGRIVPVFDAKEAVTAASSYGSGVAYSGAANTSAQTGARHLLSAGQIMPINKDAALYKQAQAQGLGYMQTDEYNFTKDNVQYRAQVFDNGILYVKVPGQGENWGPPAFVPKPENIGGTVGDPSVLSSDIARAAYSAGYAQFQNSGKVTVAINHDAALYRQAQSQGLGYPQSNEATFKDANGQEYKFQVFEGGIIYVPVYPGDVLGAQYYVAPRPPEWP